MNRDKILVSVIIPVYNVEKYLQECIETVLNQTHKNIEVILVNDGSLDNSGSIADLNATKDSRIKVIHKKNSGVSATRNVGLKIAKGDYICFADADDCLEPSYVEYLLDLIISNNADASVTTEMSTTFRRKKIYSPNIEVISGHEAAISILCYNMPIGVYCKMFKKDLIKDIFFEENLFIGEGFNFNTDAFQQAQTVVIGHKSIYHYRRDNEASAMTRFNIDKVKCALQAIECIDSKIRKKTKDIIDALKFARWHTHCDMLWFIIAAGKEKEYQTIFSECYLIAQRDAYIAFRVPTSKEERLRALITWIYPKTLGYLIDWRSRMHNQKKK